MAHDHGTNVDRDELEETILREYRHDDLVACFGVVVKEGDSTCVGLNEELCRVVKSGRGMFSQQWWWVYPKCLFNFCNRKFRVVNDNASLAQATPRSDSKRKFSTSATAPS